ncbi:MULTISPECIES: hypothetical protein [Streptomyces]|uniref:hypothetical protein n=1 Tax=Streptomyces TaxID=1883 RepID=UPI000A369488|nr:MULTISPECIES: hypothetical protein [Streptomyces]MDX3637134.1 hypothetical protein [Streptomyces europaeiscabiei]MDX3655278.1 hypothetical protein [Streptomyces europaeiscabiei]WRZ53624.1 hypothetical protein OG622_45475 [Streptomyces sp. NBC_01314]
MTTPLSEAGPAGMLAGLAAVGYTVRQRDGFAVFDYTIEVGPRTGETVRIGLALVQDWPLSPPPGPHVSPCFGHPHGAVHPSPLEREGEGWEYWSRPAADWPADRTVRGYLRHLRTLFSQLEPPA